MDPSWHIGKWSKNSKHVIKIHYAGVFLFYCHFHRIYPYILLKDSVPLPDYLIVWWIGWRIGWKIGQWECTIGRSHVILKNRMESVGVWHVKLDRMNRMPFYISIEMHYGVNITNIVCDLSDSGTEKSVRIRWNRSTNESHQITFVYSHTIKLFKIGQWDTA